MNFNINFGILTIVIIILSILGASLEIIYLVWYTLSFIIIFRVYSHIRFILLILELVGIITLALVLYFLFKTGVEIRFLFLFLCIIVGEARLGLSLIILRSRNQSNELVSLNLISSFGRIVH